MGAGLARILNDAIDNQVDDENTRADIIARMADEAGISSGTVSEILAGKIDCPPEARLRAFARVLRDVTVDDLIRAAEGDGCSYGDDEPEEQSFDSVPKSGTTDPPGLERCYAPLGLAGGTGPSDQREYGVSFIRSGRVRQRNGELSSWTIPPETLRKAVEKLNSVAVFVDHTGWFQPPSLRNLAGVTFEPEFSEENLAIEGGIRLYSTSEMGWVSDLLDQIVVDQNAGRQVPDVGLSMVFFGEHEWQGPDENPHRVTTEITHVESVDLVFGPGAEGRVKEILSKQNGGVTMPGNGNDKQLASLEAQVAKLTEGMVTLVAALGKKEDESVVTDMGTAPRDQKSTYLSHPLAKMFTSRDQVQAAYEQLMGLDNKEDVHQLTGIRELYLLLTGDYYMRGELGAGFQQLAYSPSGNNADTTTMAELTRNVLNKVLVAQIAMLEEYQWWRRVARIDNFRTLQDANWVRYGGIGYDTGTGLPTVAEKGEYQQLLWEDDRTTASFVKRGGYLALSLEMIDKDDLMGWRDVPRQLALASVVGLSSVVSALFTDNSGAGADLADSVGDGYAFNTTRGNLITGVLDYDNWNDSIDTMYKLAQLKNSSQTEDRRIAARPRFLLTPIELEGQGISVVTSAAKPGTDFNDRVATKRLLPEDNVITVPHWTNTSNWAAVADPRLLPFVGVGFRFGDIPELFTPANSNNIIFLNDVLPIKVRWFYAVGVIETRGAIKSNP